MFSIATIAFVLAGCGKAVTTLEGVCKAGLYNVMGLDCACWAGKMSAYASRSEADKAAVRAFLDIKPTDLVNRNVARVMLDNPRAGGLSAEAGTGCTRPR